MQYIDSHLHLQDYKLNNAPQFIAQMRHSSVLGAICPATDESNWEKVIGLACQYPDFVVPALGLHPWYINQASATWNIKLEKILRQNPKCLIGECGLDRLKNTNPEPQKQIFATHIDIAIMLNRSLIVHAVKSDEWLQDFWSKLKDVKFVLHSFSGSVELLKQALNYGAYISFSPTITRKKIFSKIAQYVPTNRLMLESDGPYQGSTFDIANLTKIVAECKNIDIIELYEQVLNNTKEFINV